MTGHYCLTVEIESKAIAGGLGYMVAFTLPDGKLQPAQMAEFSNWHDDVKNAVLRAGDQVFATDAYTRKLAIAELMNELSALNGAYPIHIGGAKGLPAVQIQSSNPHDARIDIDFSAKEGHFIVKERAQTRPAPASLRIGGHGQTGLIEAAREFPFHQDAPKPAPQKKHAPRKPRP